MASCSIVESLKNPAQRALVADNRDNANMLVLSGRTQADEDSKLAMFAVGDNDQNIYTFKGSSVEFIRRVSLKTGTGPGVRYSPRSGST